MKTSYKIPIIVIPAVLILSFFVISFDTGLGDTPYDIEVQFDAEKYSVKYFVVNGNTDNIEIDIPLDMIDGVFMIYVNDQVVNDERIILDGNKIIVNHDQNIESVKLMGSHDLVEFSVSKFSNQQCADQFNKLLQEERERYVPCNSSTDESGNTVVCEPKGQGWYIIANDTFNQTGCPLTYKDWAYLTNDNDLVHGIYSPRYEIEMEKTNLDRYIPISIEKWGFDACDSFYLRIINHDNRDEVLSVTAYEGICAFESEQIKRQKFVYDLDPIELPRGNYMIYLYDKYPLDTVAIEHYKELTTFYFSSYYIHEEK